MTDIVDALDMALPLAAELERRGIEYAIGGALALGIWSDPRGTRDVDINVFVSPERLDDVFAAILAIGASCDTTVARAQANDRGMFVAALPTGCVSTCSRRASTSRGRPAGLGSVRHRGGTMTWSRSTDRPSDQSSLRRKAPGVVPVHLRKARVKLGSSV